MQRSVVELHRDPRASASAARLRYEHPHGSGIRRRRAGKGFAYFDGQGSAIRNPVVLARIRRLAIPPAWTDVWIARSPDAHLQATGYDARGRKQYRYHATWRQVRDIAKFGHVVPFARALPRLRRVIARHLNEEGLGRNKVLAVVVALMDRTQLRVGNQKYTEQNGSFGLTTLQNRHVRVHGDELELHFRAKGGKVLDVHVRDRRLARAVQVCRETPGQALFQYYDELGARHAVTSTDVNEYLRAAMGGEFTAKEFRTWAASSLAARHLSEHRPCVSVREGKRALGRVAELVARELGNTPAICRKSYIHPGIFDSYLTGRLHGHWERSLRRARRARALGLTATEAGIVHLLEMLAELNDDLALCA